MAGLVRAATRFLRDESGAAVTEYALVLALVAGLCLAAHGALSRAVGACLARIAATLTG